MTEHRLACFGKPTLFSFDSPTCTGCRNRVECQRASYRKAVALSEVVDMHSILAMHESRTQVSNRSDKEAVEVSIAAPKRTVRAKAQACEITPEQRAMLAGLPVKVAAKLSAMLRRGTHLKATTALRSGINPFATGERAFMRIAGDMLLAGGFTRSELRAALIADLDVSPMTGKSYVAQVFVALPALGVAVETYEGRLVLSPSLTGDNAR